MEADLLANNLMAAQNAARNNQQAAPAGPPPSPYEQFSNLPPGEQTEAAMLRLRLAEYGQLQSFEGRPELKEKISLRRSIAEKVAVAGVSGVAKGATKMVLGGAGVPGIGIATGAVGGAISGNINARKRSEGINDENNNVENAAIFYAQEAGKLNRIATEDLSEGPFRFGLRALRQNVVRAYTSMSRFTRVIGGYGAVENTLGESLISPGQSRSQSLANIYDRLFDGAGGAINLEGFNPNSLVSYYQEILIDNKIRKYDPSYSPADRARADLALERLGKTLAGSGINLAAQNGIVDARILELSQETRGRFIRNVTIYQTIKGAVVGGLVGAIVDNMFDNNSNNYFGGIFNTNNVTTENINDYITANHLDLSSVPSGLDAILEARGLTPDQINLFKIRYLTDESFRNQILSGLSSLNSNATDNVLAQADNLIIQNGGLNANFYNNVMGSGLPFNYTEQIVRGNAIAQLSREIVLDGGADVTELQQAILSRTGTLLTEEQIHRALMTLAPYNLQVQDVTGNIINTGLIDRAGSAAQGFTSLDQWVDYLGSGTSAANAEMLRVIEVGQTDILGNPQWLAEFEELINLGNSGVTTILSETGVDAILLDTSNQTIINQIVTLATSGANEQTQIIAELLGTANPSVDLLTSGMQALADFGLPVALLGVMFGDEFLPSLQDQYRSVRRAGRQSEILRSLSEAETLNQRRAGLSQAENLNEAIINSINDRAALEGLRTTIQRMQDEFGQGDFLGLNDTGNRLQGVLDLIAAREQQLNDAQNLRNEVQRLSNEIGNLPEINDTFDLNSLNNLQDYLDHINANPDEYEPAVVERARRYERVRSVENAVNDIANASTNTVQQIENQLNRLNTIGQAELPQHQQRITELRTQLQNRREGVLRDERSENFQDRRVSINTYNDEVDLDLVEDEINVDAAAGRLDAAQRQVLLTAIERRRVDINNNNSADSQRQRFANISTAYSGTNSISNVSSQDEVEIRLRQLSQIEDSVLSDEQVIEKARLTRELTTRQSAIQSEESARPIIEQLDTYNKLIENSNLINTISGERLSEIRGQVEKISVNSNSALFLQRLELLSKIDQVTTQRAQSAETANRAPDTVRNQLDFAQNILNDQGTLTDMEPERLQAIRQSIVNVIPRNVEEMAEKEKLIIQLNNAIQGKQPGAATTTAQPSIETRSRQLFNAINSIKVAEGDLSDTLVQRVQQELVDLRSEISTASPARISQLNELIKNYESLIEQSDSDQPSSNQTSNTTQVQATSSTQPAQDLQQQVPQGTLGDIPFDDINNSGNQSAENLQQQSAQPQTTKKVQIEVDKEEFNENEAKESEIELKGRTEEPIVQETKIEPENITPSSRFINRIDSDFSGDDTWEVRLKNEYQEYLNAGLSSEDALTSAEQTVINDLRTEKNTGRRRVRVSEYLNESQNKNDSSSSSEGASNNLTSAPSDSEGSSEEAAISAESPEESTSSSTTSSTVIPDSEASGSELNSANDSIQSVGGLPLISDESSSVDAGTFQAATLDGLVPDLQTVAPMEAEDISDVEVNEALERLRAQTDSLLGAGNIPEIPNPGNPEVNIIDDEDFENRINALDIDPDTIDRRKEQNALDGNVSDEIQESARETEASLEAFEELESSRKEGKGRSFSDVFGSLRVQTQNDQEISDDSEEELLVEAEEAEPVSTAEEQAESAETETYNENENVIFQGENRKIIAINDDGTYRLTGVNRPVAKTELSKPKSLPDTFE